MPSKVVATKLKTGKKSATIPALIRNGRSHERIMQGTLRAITMRGPKLLSMVDVCDAAGISRATLYRYYSDKEQLLEAVSKYTSDSFINGLIDVAKKMTDPVELLREVLEFTWRFTAKVQSRNLLEVEPHFVMQFLESHFEEHLAAFNDALAPAYAKLERHFGMRFNRLLISEFLIRGQESTAIIRARENWNSLPKVLPTLLKEMLSQAPPKSRRK